VVNVVTCLAGGCHSSGPLGQVWRRSRSQEFAFGCSMLTGAACDIFFSGPRPDFMEIRVFSRRQAFITISSIELFSAVTSL
jgi:hypothetical protein